MEVSDDPIISTACHCTSCTTAAGRLEGLPTAVPLMSGDGGTHYVLYRKDRVRFPKGIAGLAAFHLNAQSPTRRVVTTCCQTPVFLEFKNGHWLSIYASLWNQEDRPALDIRTMTKDQPGDTIPDDVPAGGLATARFMRACSGRGSPWGSSRPG